MSDKDAAGQLQIPEEFTQQMESMRAQMEAFRAEIAERDGRITEQAQTIEAQRARIDGLVETNLRARFSRQAEALPHVGAENEGLTDQLMWLHAADDTEGRNHFDFWSNLLQTYEAAMSQSKAFSEVGQVGHRTGGTARARFSTLVAEEAAKRNLVVREGDQNWATLAMEVASSNAELYKQYLVEQRGQ